MRRRAQHSWRLGNDQSTRISERREVFWTTSGPLTRVWTGLRRSCCSPKIKRIFNSSRFRSVETVVAALLRPERSCWRYRRANQRSSACGLAASRALPGDSPAALATRLRARALTPVQEHRRGRRDPNRQASGRRPCASGPVRAASASAPLSPLSVQAMVPRRSTLRI